MNYEELFIDSSLLPQSLSKEETYKLLEKGTKNAKEKLIIHNIRLVLYEVSNKFKYVDYDKKDLVSIGIIGLIQAIDNFDTSKNTSFSTFAIKCIDNKIKDFLKMSKKNNKEISLYSSISSNKEATLIQCLSSDIDIVEECLNKEIIQIVINLINDLPERNQKIIKMYFSFNYKQKEIAQILNISRQTVSSVITNFLKKTRNYFETGKVKRK